MVADSVIYIYALVNGPGFDVHGYAKSVGPEAGAVMTRRHVGPVHESDQLTYWCGAKVASSRIGLSDNVEALLRAMKDSNPSKWGGRTTIQIVDEAVSSDDRGGYHLTQSAIELLAKFGCEIDIDVRQGDLV